MLGVSGVLAAGGVSLAGPAARLCAAAVVMRTAVGPQQFLRRIPVANSPNAVTLGFIARPTQLTDANAQNIVRAVLRRVGRPVSGDRAGWRSRRPARQLGRMSRFRAVRSDP